MSEETSSTCANSNSYYRYRTFSFLIDNGYIAIQAKTTCPPQTNTKTNKTTPTPITHAHTHK